MCDKPLVYPLKLIFRASFQEGVLPDCWEKTNVVHIHKKESKNLLKSVDQSAFFEFLAKYTERIIFKELFNDFHQNELFTKCQSGFLRGDSCISVIVYCTRN